MNYTAAEQTAYEDGKEAFAEWAADGHPPTEREAMKRLGEMDDEGRYSLPYMNGWLDAAIAATR